MVRRLDLQRRNGCLNARFQRREEKKIALRMHVSINGRRDCHQIVSLSSLDVCLHSQSIVRLH
jgi:hypothetical protein